jgi:hypothetical protein
VKCLPEHYYAAAQERWTQALLLRRADEWAIAMYVSGLAAECMVRAFIPIRTEFDERHDLVRLLKVAEWELSADLRRRRDTALNLVGALWDNAFRFASEERVRARLRQLGLNRGADLHKGADFLKVRCVQLEEAASVVEIGRNSWKKR